MTDDTAAKAVRLLRARGLSALPVADHDRLVGLLHEADVAALLAAAPDAAGPALGVEVGRLMRPIGLLVTDEQDLVTILRILREQDGTTGGAGQPRSLDCAAVVSREGRYLGLVLRRDLLAAIAGEPPAPPIAGLATPFGVHLTTGAVRAGAGDLALAGTGAVLMLLGLLANGILYGLGKLLTQVLPAAAALATDLGAARAVPGFIAQVALFLLLLRLLPLTGVHAAEHMVVHAIEEGEDLTLAKVRPMPRVHPRCGTNLMALMALTLISLEFVISLGALADAVTTALVFFALMIVIVFGWRRLGSGLQRWVTTRPPSDRQLEQAIKVGSSLLAQVRLQPAAYAGDLARFWRTGLLQVVAGFTAASIVVHYGWPLLLAAWSHLHG
jgi:CBS domain-containing protein